MERRVKKILFVLVASDKGLAGSFNSSVFKKFDRHMERDREKYKNEEKLYVAIGEKAFQYLVKKKLPVLQKFIQVGDYGTPEQVEPIAELIIDGYLAKNWDRVIIISMHFVSALRQEPHVRKLLPTDYDHIKETVQELVPPSGKFAEIVKDQQLNGTEKKEISYLIEPSPDIVLRYLVQHLISMQLYQLILEANAAEHSARRMAMKTASDNASDLSDNLNLEYNKSRQAAITKEIIEISAGAEALS